MEILLMTRMSKQAARLSLYGTNGPAEAGHYITLAIESATKNA